MTEMKIKRTFASLVVLTVAMTAALGCSSDADSKSARVSEAPVAVIAGSEEGNESKPVDVADAFVITKETETEKGSRTVTLVESEKTGKSEDVTSDETQASGESLAVRETSEATSSASAKEQDAETQPSSLSESAVSGADGSASAKKQTESAATLTSGSSIKSTKTSNATETAESTKNHTHKWIIETKTEATCTENGAICKRCSVCGEVKRDVVKALGHNYVKKTITVTTGPILATVNHDEVGSYDDVYVQEEYCQCNWCGADASLNMTCGIHICPNGMMPMNWHTGHRNVSIIRKWHMASDAYSEVVTVNSGMERKITVYQCSRCGLQDDSRSGQNDHVHDFATYVDYGEVRCNSTGTRVYYCSVCGETKEETAGGTEEFHWWYSTDGTAPTCTADGYRTYHCMYCNATKTETIPALGGDHNYVIESQKSASCTENGLTVMRCTRCQEASCVVAPAFGHNYVIISDERPSNYMVTPGEYAITYQCQTCGNILNTTTMVSAGGVVVETSDSSRVEMH